MRPHIKERYECSQWMEFGGGRRVALVLVVKNGGKAAALQRLWLRSTR
jgi:hypothetical protein